MTRHPAQMDVFGHLNIVHDKVMEIHALHRYEFTNLLVEIHDNRPPIPEGGTAPALGPDDFEAHWAVEELDAYVMRALAWRHREIPPEDKEELLKDLRETWPPTRQYHVWMKENSDKYPAVYESFVLLNYIRYCLIQFLASP